MDHMQAPLSSPEAIERFRLVAQTALEVRGHMDADLKALLDRKAQELAVHRLDAEQVMAEVLGGRGWPAACTRTPRAGDAPLSGCETSRTQVGRALRHRRWARAGNRTGQEITGPDGGTYVWVRSGEFEMGSRRGSGNERPVHRVRISKGFWLSKCQVTNGQYRAYCDATGREFPEDSDQGSDHPVTHVSWDDAMAFCEHYGLRLPTEVEWEYAARGADGRTYPWGSRWSVTRCCNTHNRSPGGRTLAVGSLPTGASWCGALDMAGNVWEWCADWYRERYYEVSPLTNPTGPASGHERVVRGGGWDCDADVCRSACRDGVDPAYRDNSTGIRPVVAPR